ncbi:Gfo/Idh/MocA family protein [Caballeronia novacaledonica]|uniref:Gfo/Idh/MocA family oxidoreductase n=1 Tax=Caballeronia novacaledonica TaxID=1544861 RepID=A0AA37IIM8_9BURK|nr:Gfo/Idh/MocA family oxidoreductase [Caballeronia novacaledonica]GJH29409.1 Gfo/Idh/MocA family oxidoreductase [Caballeronia novacaledonica]
MDPKTPSTDMMNSANEMLRGALIGCGFFAKNHLHAWSDVAGVGIVAICDSDSERLKATANEFGIDRTYTDAAEMIDSERLDFVDIATTVRSHRPLVELAAHAGIAVICQKPFASTLQDAKAMVHACDKADVPLMVHENFRWQPAIQAVGRALASHAIGTPYWGRVSFRSAFDVFSGQPYLAEGARFIIEDLGIHILDIARFLFGNVDQITASTTRVNPSIKGEDVATMLLRHESGMTSIVDCSYATHLPQELFPQTLLEVDGTAGSLRLLSDYRLQIHTRDGTSVETVSMPALSWTSRPWQAIQSSVYAIQAHWIDCLRTGQKPATSGHDNLQTLALVEAAYDSAQTRRAVEIASLLKAKQI